MTTPKSINVTTTQYDGYDFPEAECFHEFLTAHFARVYPGFEVEAQEGDAFKVVVRGCDNDDDMEEEIAALMPDVWERFCSYGWRAHSGRSRGGR